jgi:hypothetical protein
VAVVTGDALVRLVTTIEGILRLVHHERSCWDRHSRWRRLPCGAGDGEDGKLIC